MASISNLVTTTLLPEGAGIAPDNMNVVCVMTSAQGVLTSADRYRAYSNAADVTTDWGSASPVSAYANTFFGTQPNAVQAGGYFVVGYHRGASETVAATAGVLTGAQLNEADVISQLQSISAGSFTVTYDDDESATSITGLDFRVVTSMADVVALIQAELDTDATITYSNNRLKITSATTGADSNITLLAAAGSGTFVGVILGLAAGTGAVSTAGEAGTTLSSETQLAALGVVKALVNFKGVCFIDAIIDNDVAGIATWSKANDVIVYNVFSGSDYYAVDVTNPVWAVKLAGQTTFRCLYRADGDRKFACTYMARNHTVNFNAENSAITMQGKQLAIVSEDLSQTVINACKTVGLDVYVAIKSTPLVPLVLTSGANDFVDNVYNLIAFIDAVQSDVATLITGTPTKIPQTTPGINSIVDQAEKTTRRFAKAGFIAPGEWLSPNTFGNVDTFKRNISEFGYYWMAGSLADQSSTDRSARKSPPLMCAIKYAGAVNSAEIIIQFNR